MMAILTRTSVHVFDAKCKINTESDDSTPIVKRIYSAFDCIDHMSPEKNRIELLRVRWHPRVKDMLVILTSDSRIFYVQCSRSSGASGIGCHIRFHLDLGDFQRCIADVTAYSDVENKSASSADEEDEMNSSNRSCGKLDLERALGGSCVDFDFGTAVLRPGTRWRLEKDQELDCCLYLLCESGDVLRLSGCLSSAHNSSSLNIQTLHILPPSADNYGDDFCALLSFSSSHCRDLPNQMILSDAPPDVLVLANRSGRMCQGVVLQSTGRGAKHPGNRSFFIRL
ncbi:unnamed protein product [Echinostoma caproni]|uniref:Anaphase-promoting complex subunit 1 n=1 Tax=Echinostoma caproni TaxID=27848 RepID=A0A183BA33_9TREM|nr:unnamed protein product [Echinostoma caproni]